MASGVGVSGGVTGRATLDRPGTTQRSGGRVAMTVLQPQQQQAATALPQLPNPGLAQQAQQGAAGLPQPGAAPHSPGRSAVGAKQVNNLPRSRSPPLPLSLVPPLPWPSPPLPVPSPVPFLPTAAPSPASSLPPVPPRPPPRPSPPHSVPPLVPPLPLCLAQPFLNQDSCHVPVRVCVYTG